MIVRLVDVSLWSSVTHKPYFFLWISVHLALFEYGTKAEYIPFYIPFNKSVTIVWSPDYREPQKAIGDMGTSLEVTLFGV